MDKKNKNLHDELMTDPMEVAELWDIAEASDKILMLQGKLKEMRMLVNLFEEDADTREGGKDQDVGQGARKALQELELEIKYLIDTYLGVGGLVNVDAESDRVLSGRYLGWGARKPEDLDGQGAGIDIPPTIPVAEAYNTIKDLIKLANEWDQKGLIEEANSLDKVIQCLKIPS